MKLFLIVIYYLSFQRASSRVHTNFDVENLCTNNPSLNLCKLRVVSRQRRAGFLGSPGDPYCDGNRDQFGNSCNNRFSDSGQNDFCSTYGIKCRGWKPYNQVQAAQTIGVSGASGASPQVQSQLQSQQRPFQAQPQVVQSTDPNHPLPPTFPSGTSSNAVTNQKIYPQDQATSAYCKTYGKDYYDLCLKGPIPDFSLEFCDGFIDRCPGVPAPGQVIGRPRGNPRPLKVVPYPTEAPPRELPIHSNYDWGPYSNPNWRANPNDWPVADPLLANPAATPTKPIVPYNPIFPANAVPPMTPQVQQSIPTAPIGTPLNQLSKYTPG